MGRDTYGLFLGVLKRTEMYLTDVETCPSDECRPVLFVCSTFLEVHVCVCVCLKNVYSKRLSSGVLLVALAKDV